MRTVFVTAWTPTLGSGRALRVYGIVRALAEHGEVDLVWRRFDAPEPSAEFRALAPRVRMHEVVAPGLPRRALDALAARARGVSAELARGALPVFGRRARELAGAGDRIVADGPIVAAALLPLAQRRPVVYLAHNLEAERVPQHARTERRVLEVFAEAWQCTEHDAQGARRLAPAGARQRVVPNVVDAEAIRPATAPAPPPPTVLYVADFSYAPNLEGLELLLTDVLPRVCAAVPDARAAIAGRHLPALDAGPQVDLLGFVDDLGALYRRCAVAVVPLLRGGGSPLKFAEALAHGVPVVATEHAAGALTHGSSPDHFLSGPDLAPLIVEVLRGEHPGLGDRGRRLAEEHLSIRSIVPLVAP